MMSDRLPPEIWEQIFTSLSNADLKNVSLVCKDFCRISYPCLCRSPFLNQATPQFFSKLIIHPIKELHLADFDIFHRHLRLSNWLNLDALRDISKLLRKIPTLQRIIVDNRRDASLGYNICDLRNIIDLGYNLLVNTRSLKYTFSSELSSAFLHVLSRLPPGSSMIVESDKRPIVSCETTEQKAQAIMAKSFHLNSSHLTYLSKLSIQKMYLSAYQDIDYKDLCSNLFLNETMQSFVIDDGFSRKLTVADLSNFICLPVTKVHMAALSVSNDNLARLINVLLDIKCLYKVSIDRAFSGHAFKATDLNAFSKLNCKKVLHTHALFKTADFFSKDEFKRYFEAIKLIQPDSIMVSRGLDGRGVCLKFPQFKILCRRFRVVEVETAAVDLHAHCLKKFTRFLKDKEDVEIIVNYRFGRMKFDLSTLRKLIGLRVKELHTNALQMTRADWRDVFSCIFERLCVGKVVVSTLPDFPWSSFGTRHNVLVVNTNLLNLHQSSGYL